MILPVEDITEESLTCDFSDPVEDINRRLESGPHDFRFVHAIEVHLDHYRADDNLFFAGHLSTVAQGECARCTETFAYPVEQDFSFVLRPVDPEEEREEERNELSSDDLSVTTYEGEEVDLAPLVEEQALVALPTRALCSEDCRGLCPTCGANRNLDSCRCPASEGDARLVVLRNLKAGRAQ
ncbi:MAG: hypothetical protein RL698_3101 [Pseudomonadota bacterium]|jgi:uncharacterized protein